MSAGMYDAIVARATCLPFLAVSMTIGKSWDVVPPKATPGAGAFRAAEASRWEAADAAIGPQRTAAAAIRPAQRRREVSSAALHRCMTTSSLPGPRRWRRRAGGGGTTARQV